MKQKFLCVFVFSFPFFVFSQAEIESRGIQWTERLTWKQIQQKAKEENKYIFVDCYATWCKPCKEMDQKVYTVDSVGTYLNSQFISVKLQMDVTGKDNADVESWHKTAREIEDQYRINAYPSYVFFAPNGEVVSKATGYKDPPTFIQVARNATDTAKQYFPLLKKYKQGKLDHEGTVALINMAKEIGDTADYRQILKSYYAYLNKQKKEKLYTKENIEFIASTLDRSNMVLFKLFYPDARAVNKVMKSSWYANKVVDNIIFKEKANSFLGAAEGKAEPDWNILYRSIAKDYKQEYAERVVMDAKMRWYWFYKDMWKYTLVMNDKMEKYGSDTTSRSEDFILNNLAFLIWEAVGNTVNPSQQEIRELKRVSEWMKGVVRRGASATGFRLEQWHMYIDTYANLLYKIGRTTEAINWQEFAILKCKEIGGGWSDNLKGYEANLEKMKKGEPTWPIAELKR